MPDSVLVQLAAVAGATWLMPLLLAFFEEHRHKRLVGSVLSIVIPIVALVAGGDIDGAMDLLLAVPAAVGVKVGSHAAYKSVWKETFRINDRVTALKSALNVPEVSSPEPGSENRPGYRPAAPAPPLTRAVPQVRSEESADGPDFLAPGWLETP